ncbi:MAG: alkaline phosphatase [Candidatus Krumholzibacteriales bacterium]
MRFIKSGFTGIFLITLAALLCSCQPDSSEDIRTGNVIFIHPDGSGPSMWTAMRIYYYGPDSLSGWERMEGMGLYRSHALNSTNSSSRAGATIHSHGVKVRFNSYGSCAEKPVRALSGKDCSIMTEARKACISTALINSGHICEPGAGVFVAGSERRSNERYSADIVDNIPRGC